MSPIGSPFDDLSDTWRFALLGGLASIPFTAYGYWQTGSEMSFAPVFFGAILAGFVAKRKTGTARGVGVRTGLVGGLPGLWVAADILSATSGLAGPSWFVASGFVLALGAALLVVLLSAGIAALVGKVGASVGGGLAGSTGPRRPPAASS
ncbi:hypothetical protein SAMN06269185_2432 [Natronoarchaeum philippinense]|uniref:DUF5518 domain-containing protein n=1 Tax=Natronoarchaeum philippinense TaxID=558529 RepID=A0A285P510_NATPI|nr:DUF5518 domain-containing protein [Natronoarchaeum philippinense]SNZ15246.1 hypothetical protein SAMN06269185_2432 [Natronoarchaeum philippinense]